MTLQSAGGDPALRQSSPVAGKDQEVCLCFTTDYAHSVLV